MNRSFVGKDFFYQYSLDVQRFYSRQSINCESTADGLFNSKNVPDDIWLKIFSYLPINTVCSTLSKVCKHWRDLTHDKELWRNVWIPEQFTLIGGMLDDLFSYIDFSIVKNLSYLPIFLLDEVILMLTIIDTTIESLSFYNCTHLSDFGAFNISKLTKLNNLLLQNCPSVTNDTIISIVQKLDGLKSLHISGCCITNTSLITISKLKHLISLQLNVKGSFTVDGIITMLKNFKNLINLDLEFIDNFQRKSIHDLAHQSVTRQAGKYLPYLRCDSLTSLRLTSLWEGGDDDLLKVFQNNKSLNCLILETCHISGSFIYANHNLKKLVLSDCNDLQESFYAYFKINGMDELHVTINSECDSRMTFQYVKQLSLEIDLLESDTDMANIASLMSKNLVSLCLRGPIDQKTLSFIFANCKTLKKLYFNDFCEDEEEEEEFCSLSLNSYITEFYGKCYPNNRFRFPQYVQG